MTTTTRTFQLEPIDSAAAERLRAAGGVAYTADVKPGYPCRRCLLDAEIGASLILVAHDPFTQDSPYRSSSPIFLHAESCAPDAAALDGPELPDQLTVRQLSVRAFDEQAMMIDAAVIAGTDLRQTLDTFFANAATDVVHVHNASRGCWAVNVRRS